MERESELADRAGPPTRQSVDDEPAISHAERRAEHDPNQCQRQSFTREQSACHLGSEARGQENAVLARTAFDREPKQQPHQARCRGHQKHAHGQKQHAKVGRALRRSQRLLAHWTKRHAKRGQPQPAQQAAPDLLHAREAADTDRGNPSAGRIIAAVEPEVLERVQRDDGLGCRPEVVPVRFVLGPDALGVDWEGRIPVAHVPGIGDALEVGHDPSVEGCAFHVDHAHEPELAACSAEFAARASHVIVHLDDIARLRAEVCAGPLT